MKNYLIFTILIIFFISLHYVVAESKLNIKSFTAKSDFNKDLARTRRRPFGFFNPLMGYGFGLHALAIIYWLKVKAVIITFIVGTAIIWGAKYFWPNKSCPKQIETVNEGAIIPFDHGPIWSSSQHHDHIPYSSYHHDHTPYSSLSFADHEPYSAYNSYSDSSPLSEHGTEEYLDHNPNEKKWKRKVRSVRKQQHMDNENTEDQISDFMFLFLGVGSTECRKRFLCEWEYQAQRHPLTRMAFRIFGRGVFRKYARDPKDENSAKSFRDCARVHNQCTVIEEDNALTETTNNENENTIYNNEEESTTKDPIAIAIFSHTKKSFQ